MWKHMKSKVITLCVVLVVYFSTTCFGEISGYIKDYRGNSVSGATITFTDESNPGNVYSAITDTKGGYEITGIETIIDEKRQSEPLSFELFQNYPNPFNPETRITYHLAEEVYTRLVIYNPRGQIVRRLVDRTQNQGAYTVTWDGRDAFGNRLPSGVYIYRLRAGRRVHR